MSEPYCVLSRVQISPARSREYLQASRRRASSYDDWDGCSGFIDTTSLQSPERWDAWLAQVDTAASVTNGEALLGFRKSVFQPSMFRFYYDHATEELHQATLLYSQGARELVAHLAVSRGIADFLQADETGLIAVVDPFMGNGTVGVVSIRAGQSQVVESDARTEALVAELPNLEELEVGKGRDELDSFLGA